MLLSASEIFSLDLRTRRRAALLGGALGRQTLELVGRVVDVAHRGCDCPVARLVRDQAVHLLADTTVRGMTWGDVRSSSMCIASRAFIWTANRTRYARDTA